MPDILLFLWAKYMSQVCKLATEVESNTVSFVKYFAGQLLRQRQGYMTINGSSWAMVFPWLYEVLKSFWDKYKLHDATLATLVNHHKIRKAVRALDQTSSTAHFDQFISCFRYALWKARNLLINRHLDLTVEDCIKMGLSEMYWYYRKTAEDNTKVTADLIWWRRDWH
ncbi:hypothetical protein Y1Q_0000676 [Alligator mississippiensis]|uniref:Uncharacterized protein n=1 Tax=Alligator mississippiensis TaxID=8496 RepID=A0A151MC19_ALLMI|nr:hypothetical protein Y1Q_0000676 [Alligator mississippiensis]